MMKSIQIPYYTSSLDLHVEESNLEAVITAKTDSFDPGMSEAALVEQALANPIGTPRLRDIVRPGEKIGPGVAVARKLRTRHRMPAHKDEAMGGSQ